MIKNLWKAAGLPALLSLAGIAAETAPAAPQPAAPQPAAPDITRQPTLHVIGYSHLDTQWCWLYPQVINEYVRNTLDENFARLEKYPSFIINFSGANRYRMMKEYYPEKYERVKAYAAQGRWFPAGNSMEENDVNVPSAEAIIRQLLYGNHWFKSELGVTSKEFMLPDCFGFPASLPSLLAHAGLKGFSTQKLSWGSAVGIPFNIGVWTGPDGNSVIGALNAGDYTANCPAGIARDPNWLKRVQDDGAKSGVFADYRYHGVGDRGGAPRDESCSNLEAAVNDAGAPLKVVSAKSDELFKQITPEMAAKLPHYQGDLLLTEHSAGSITSAAYMKRWHHQSELLATAAEKAAVMADWMGARPYDRHAINEAWYLVSLAEFHDILPGTSLPQAYVYSQNDLALAMKLFSGVATDAVGSVAAALDTQGAGIPLVVYNPLTLAREDVVEATVRFSGPAPAAIRVLNAAGKEVPSQVNGRGEEWLKIAFVAKVVPSGMAVHRVVPAKAASASQLKVSETGLENARYRVALDQNGDIASIVDKEARRELLAAPLRLAFQYENPGNYPAWNMDWNDQRKPPRGFVTGPAKVTVSENGAARVAVTVERTTEGSVFRQTVRLAAGSDRVEFLDIIDWRSKQCALKATFPFAVANPEATYSWEVGTVRRGNNNPKKYEVPTHQWLDLSNPDGKYGVTLLTGSKYGSDKPADNTIRLTLIYTPGVRGGFQHEQWQDWGRHEILYGLAGHRGAQPADWQGYRLDQPLLAFQTVAHAGKLGKSFSLLSVSNERIRVLATKKAEDGNETIVRLVNLDSTPAKGVKLEFARPVVAVREVTGCEEPVGPAILKKGALVTDFGGFGIRTFAVTLGEPPATLAIPEQKPLPLVGDLRITSQNEEALVANVGLDGLAWPAELFPKELTVNGIRFALGAPDTANALTCRSQRLLLPPGQWNRLCLLVAAAKDGAAGFSVGGRTPAVKIQAWQGYVGQWDTRRWSGEEPKVAFDWSLQLAGLTPGYVKPGQIAAFTQHLHDAKGANLAYEYGYLQFVEIPLPEDSRDVILPSDAGLRIVAATVAAAGPACVPASDLDALPDYGSAAIQPRLAISGAANDLQQATLLPPLYWTGKTGICYTLDGAEPTLMSPRYMNPILLSATATLKSRVIENGQLVGDVLEKTIVVNDVTPPSVTSAQCIGGNQLSLQFSEPVNTAIASYEMAGNPIVKTIGSPDGGRLMLELQNPLAWDQEAVLTLKGVKDQSPQGNVVTLTVTIPPAGFLMKPAMVETAGKPVVFRDLKGLPLQAGQPWTLNAFVFVPKMPNDYTVIAGFGDGQDNAGTQRYLAKFPDQIHFWGSNIDIGTNEPLDLGKWQMLTVTFDGRKIAIYKNGKLLKSQGAQLAEAAPIVQVAPASPWSQHGNNLFAGKVANLTLRHGASSPADIAEFLKAMPKE
jgi:alpha-mannosidase